MFTFLFCRQTEVLVYATNLDILFAVVVMIGCKNNYEQEH